MGLSGKIASGLFVAMLIMAGAGYVYYTDSQKTISALTENNAKLEQSVQLNEKTIASLQKDYERVSQETQIINLALANSRQQNRLLIEKLQDHELDYLASQKPELIENLINNASDNAARCLEILSGSPLTPNEQNAETGREFNNECPWLWPGQNQ